MELDSKENSKFMAQFKIMWLRRQYKKRFSHDHPQNKNNLKNFDAFKNKIFDTTISYVCVFQIMNIHFGKY